MGFSNNMGFSPGRIRFHSAQFPPFVKREKPALSAAEGVGQPPSSGSGSKGKASRRLDLKSNSFQRIPLPWGKE